jgi:phospholipid/cholesterol/gamma-HCH transport system substrate-binding protein
VLDRTTALLGQAGALVSKPELPALLDRLEPPLRRLPGLEQRLDRLFPLVTPVSDCVRDKAVPVLQAKAPDGPLSTGYPVYLDLAHALVGLAGAGQDFDANGYAVRYMAGAGDTTITTGSAPTVGQLTGLSQSPLEGSRPQWLGPGVQPPLRPDVPCAGDAVADLSQRTGAQSVSSARRVPVARRPTTRAALRAALRKAAAK